MKRILIATCALGAAQLATPTDAHARLGFTYALGFEGASHGNYTSPFGSLPSIDWKQGPLLIQFHALEFLSGITQGDDSFYGATQFNLGTNIYYRTSKKKITDKINGVIMPGGSLDIVAGLGDIEDGSYDGKSYTVAGLWRAGAQVTGGMGFGIYVCPALGVGSVAVPDPDDGKFVGDLQLIVGGTLEVSVWDAK